MRITDSMELNNQYTNYRIESKELKEQQSVVNAQQSAALQEASSNQEIPKEQEEIKKASANANPNDFVFDFKKNNDYHLVAAKNDMEDVDVDKEISAMQKDAVLEQYKFFVNPTNLGTDADGTVRLKKM